jgi:hypothetical protein
MIHRVRNEESEGPWEDRYNQWYLFGTAGAYSPPHHDAARFGTWVEVLPMPEDAEKIWFVCHQPKDFLNWKQLADEDKLDTLEWTAYFLKPGHRLYVFLAGL